MTTFRVRRFPAALRLALLVPVLATSACNRAPAVDIAGSFFPAWLLCLTVGVVVSFAVHHLLVRRGLDAHVGSPIVFYPSLLALVTSLLWLALFR